MWRRRVMRVDEVTVERSGGKRRKWIFRYPKEGWNKDYIEPNARVGERKVSQMMTGVFHVTGKSIIDIYDHYDFVRIWEDIKRELGEEEVFLIIDNAKTHLPFIRWLRKHRITLLEIPPYSLDFNPIGNIWSLIKDKLSKQYPELYLMKGPEDMVKKAIEEAITYCWELLDPKVFDTLAGSMVDMIKATIKADR
ncbi:hypothetical protein L873DRAFT_1868353 [Choiromyces venosus 120613-1]|uniref:Tc1-like transposase DDE domain-containing protein n=1 Tax=Choiromyces venosus 120613-1 TaxID=1336337 RepID=A0A3N4J4Q5_9PEZI|nr:hypothetical protein L873DRAFT_1868353 [Choiromyces venosus 120613-1]